MVVALVCVAGSGSATASAESLPASASARFDGPLGGELGSSVAAAGDFNGDGIDDVVLGAPEPDRLGQAFVVFGRRGLGAVDLERLGDGVRIVGEDLEDGRAGTSVAGAGDVNADGSADVVVTDPRASGSSGGGDGSGRASTGSRTSCTAAGRPEPSRSGASARAGSRSRDWRTRPRRARATSMATGSPT